MTQGNDRERDRAAGAEGNGAGTPPAPPRLLYCHCAYANVVPQEVKREVLRALSDSGVAFEAVADLCEMSARKDPALKRLADAPNGVRIAACFPRAVKWLFHAAGAPYDEERTEVLNMRERPADQIVARLLEGRSRRETAAS